MPLRQRDGAVRCGTCSRGEIEMFLNGTPFDTAPVIWFEERNRVMSKGSPMNILDSMQSLFVHDHHLYNHL